MKILNERKVRAKERSANQAMEVALEDLGAPDEAGAGQKRKKSVEGTSMKKRQKTSQN